MNVVKILSFLFHTGSIKRNAPGIHTGLAARSFLFHTGSIKRESTELPIPQFHKFLFHTGSIKRYLYLIRA